MTAAVDYTKGAVQQLIVDHDSIQNTLRVRQILLANVNHELEKAGGLVFEGMLEPESAQRYLERIRISGSFHETAKVVNSIRVSTAGITQ